MSISNRRLTSLVLATVAALSIISTTVPATAGGAPLGFRVLCLKVPSECVGGGKSSVSMTTEVMATLKRVNAKYNRSIRPRPDKGVDIWTVGATSGDCED